MMPRTLRVVLAVVATVAAAGCQPDDGNNGGDVPYAINLTPDDVSAVVVETKGSSAHVARKADGWRATAGSSMESAFQMRQVQDDLLPLQAYRSVELKHDKPVYGLSEPWVTMLVFDNDGDRHRLVVGSETFNRAGFYARRDGELTTYLLVRDSVAAMLSIARGKRVELPDPTDLRIEKAARNPSSVESEATSANAVTDGGSADAWLQQSLRAGSGGKK